ncbi:choline/glycine/proline betaine transport protein [Pseudomonas taetrolens]|uniref:Choline transporter n=1 Tax=Pseudomonas taetrolens TaxID=47884 RepID=A0A0J6GKT3_PSETA|nr:choline BCCT transporter BetT [Pseudomonas taetrolens]KMM85271.1 choline transporter [Pseudomonas taetrolens]SEC39513.1 choline/glycine/proline betaine transport protein [Pseudomonas taetrolens]SQF86484.1 choline transporter BetT [Pseudomonas taetrolens]VEH49561.1 choline transporter BetT [Pseudomonas taetrolens]
MPIEPSDNKNTTAAPDGQQTVKIPAPLERSRFGGTQRRHERPDEDDAPVSRSDLSKGPEEVLEDREAHINWSVLLISSLVILAFSIWAIVMPDEARTTMKTAVDWIAINLGWYYVVTITLVIGFVLWVAFSKEGDVRIGPDHSRPQYKLVTWVAMLFAAGVGIDMLFYSVTGPVVQYLYPPSGEGSTSAARQDAVVWTMFHYGIAGWAMYALLGMAMGYFAYRWDMPLSIRAALYPLLGKRVRGPLGDGISIIALVGTVFGVATSMGIGVVLLSVGFSLIFGFEQGLTLQIALVIGAVILTIAATTSGVDRGIRWIAELNLWSAVAMMLYILFTGQTAFLLNALVENIGQFIVTFPARTLQTFAYEPEGAEWMGGWTLFFWAFWLAWGPFVGVFLARISRGRTLREFVIAAITAPVLCDFIIVSLFGNSALFEVLQGNTAFAELAVQSPEQGWYALLGMFPGSTFLIWLATLSGLLFYLTSANSGAMVMSNFSASIPDPSHDGPSWLRIFWAILTAVLTIAMLFAGGVTTMEYATLIFALPVTIVAYLVMASFYKVLRMERAEREGRVLRRPSIAPIGGHVPERSWKQRLEQLRAYPSLRQVTQFLDRTVRPALDEVAAEFRNQGYNIEQDTTTNVNGIEEPLLRVSMDAFRDFYYHVAVVEAPVPMFSGRMSRETDVYYRLEVYTQTGSGGYDLMGLTKQQIIDDVLERYEAHLAFLTFSSQTDTASVLTPPKGAGEQAGS